MFELLRRHPFPVEAFFRYSLVLTYALPSEILTPLLPPGLALDTYGDSGFLAIALVQTERLRPEGLPAFFGRSFFLSGYRIFCRYRSVDGRTLRGLRILRSDADSPFMVWSGNLLTHYGYRKCEARVVRSGGTLSIDVTTPEAEADLSVRVFVDAPCEDLPPGSPFETLGIARRFAGPLPYTFGYEPRSRQMVIVKGVRRNWKPTPVRVEAASSSFLARPPFNAVPPRLASAFFIENIPYRWERGILEAVP